MICSICQTDRAAIGSLCAGCADVAYLSERDRIGDQMQILFGLAISLSYTEAADWLQVNYPWPSMDTIRAARLETLRRLLLEDGRLAEEARRVL